MATAFARFEVDKTWDYENGFYLTSHPTRLAKAVAQYELYKSIIALPGHVIECGVYKGTSLVRFATYREMLESSHSRKIIAFDAFGRFPVEGGDASDLEFIRDFAAEGGDGLPRAEIAEVLRIKGFGNIELIEGDICQTVPAYAAEHPELKIALLHVDVDVYRPSKIVLETLFARVVSGGVVVLDDYGTVPGGTRAVDEFFSGSHPRLEKLPISHHPPYVRLR